MNKQSKTKFRHYRCVTLSGDVDPRGGVTMAYRSTTDGFSAAMSYCRETDNYQKSYGRAKAEGLLDRNAASGFSRDEECKATGNPRYYNIELEDEKAFLSLMDEEVDLNTGYLPR